MDRNIYKESSGMKAVTTSVLVKTPQQESGSVPRGQKKNPSLLKQTNFVFLSEHMYLKRNLARFEL